MRGRIERIAEPAAHFIARDDRGQHVAAGRADHFADRERRRHHRRARMQRGIGVGVVEIERVAERAIEQRRDRRRPGLAVAEHGRVALAVERQRFEHLEQRGRRFRVAPRPDRAAEKIQRQDLGALQHLPAGCPRISDRRHRRRALRFHGPWCFLAVVAQRRRADLGFQAASALRAAAMPNVVYNGSPMICQYIPERST